MLSRVTAAGRWDWGTQAGEFSGSWVARSDGDVQYRGDCKGIVQSQRFGRASPDATLAAEARTTVGNWAIAANIRGVGADWQKFQWHVSLPQIAWSRNDRQAGIAGSVAQIDVNGPVIRSISVHIPHAQNSSGGGEFHAGTRRWSAHFEAEALHLGMPQVNDVDLRLIARGDDREAFISELRVAAGERVIVAKGALLLAGRLLRDVSISADWPAGAAGPGQPQSVQPAERWNLQAGVSGRIQPLALAIEGDLTGHNIPVGKQIVPRVTIPIHANAGAQQIQMSTEPFELLSGKWQLTGQHELSGKLTQLSLVLDGMPLRAAAEIAGCPLNCQGSMDAQLQLAVPNFKVEQAVATGRWTARDVSIPPLEAQNARGKIRVADGSVRFDRLMTSLQTGAVAVQIAGTLDGAEVKTVPLPIIVGDLRRLLWARLRE